MAWSAGVKSCVLQILPTQQSKNLVDGPILSLDCPIEYRSRYTYLPNRAKVP